MNREIGMAVEMWSGSTKVHVVTLARPLSYNEAMDERMAFSYWFEEQGWEPHTVVAVENTGANPPERFWVCGFENEKHASLFFLRWG